jgi:hypothetical protein
MKYIFDVDERNNKFSIRVEIQKGNAFNANASSIVECSEEQPNWGKDLELMLQELIDNMRLTVQERTEVYKNSNILVEYLKYSNPIEQIPQADNEPQMIVENGDPAVLVQETK